jgi:dienelactone hydrolase
MKASHAFGKLALATGVAFTFVVAGLIIPTSAMMLQRPAKVAEKQKGADAAPAAKKPVGNQDEKENYQDVALQTEDGVQLSGYYFPSKGGKNSPAVILLHGYGESQKVYYDLAFDLQDRGYAALTFDFRGHGRSKQWAPGFQAKAGPNVPKLDFHELRNPAQFAALLQDIEAAKRFLVRRNNAGELNVAKLAIVGSEMGASLGVLWAFRDWQFVSTVGFTSKQGQDVLAVVLLSPQYNFKGVAIAEQLQFLQKVMPLQVVVGKKDTKAFNDADRIYKSASKAKPRDATWDAELFEVNTKLQGTKLLDPDLEFEVNQSIVKFLEASLKKRPVNWMLRETSDTEGAGGP